MAKGSKGARATKREEEEEEEEEDKFINGVRWKLQSFSKAPLQLPVPVFYPEERDTDEGFEKFIVRVEDVLEEYGIGKIVPPPEWGPIALKRNKEEMREALRERAEKLVIPKPIKQHATGGRGVFRTFLLEQKPMQVRELAREKQPEFDLDSLERYFWKNISYQPPIYGADIEGSLFDSESEKRHWNIRNLNTLLSKALEKHFLEDLRKREEKEKEKESEEGDVTRRQSSRSNAIKERNKRKREDEARRRKDKIPPSIPGVISPYLYFGMYRSFFAWHTEDVDLYSVNYLHFGAPKVWYCVPPKHRRRFESKVQSAVPDLFMHCDQFLRHKELLVSPAVLRSESVPLVRFVQRESEWVINYPGAYHAGFNCGFNCAESTNFATARWVPIGKTAKPCECSRDSVRLDMDIFERYYEEEKEEEEENLLEREEKVSSDEEQEKRQEKRKIREEDLDLGCSPECRQHLPQVKNILECEI